ncbi:sigma-70 family RNA polymerase sigma factor [Thalassoglobus sp. JC818]|uniref:RNA polymerase sigma factor n=1 Tax=Thalassoglobus sp. JC818 TaxID=3232136 RepID=UPI0034575F0B
MADDRQNLVFVKTDDLRLVEATLAGNTEAYGELVNRYQDRLFSALVHMLGSIHDARDVAQEAFLSAFEKLSTFRKEASFYSWLFRIAYNAAITNRRKLKRRAATSLEAKQDSLGFEIVDDHPDANPDHQMESEERVRQVRIALEQLSCDYRDVIVMKEMEGMRYDEIASILNCPVGTVRSRIHRARNDLRDILTRSLSPESEAFTT